MLPRISVVMAAYNVAEFVSEALDSVFRQCVDLEVILVNDGSPDSAELENAILPYRDRITYIKQSHLGRAAARNAGIRAATGNWVAVLDADDVWDPDYIRVQLDAISAEPLASVVYCNAIYFGGGGRFDGTLFTDKFPSSGEVTFETVCDGRCNIMRGTIARRDALLQCGLYPTLSDDGCEDIELHLRMLKFGAKIVYHMQPIYGLRLRPNQMSCDVRRMTMALVERLGRLDRELDLTPAERRALRERIERAKSNLELIEAKQALMLGEGNVGIAKLATANKRLKSWKIGAAVAAALFAPAYVMKLLQRREAAMAAAGPQSTDSVAREEPVVRQAA